MKEIEITEKDIFIYVYDKHSLEKTKRDYIEENEPQFSSLIDIISEANSPEVDKEEATALKMRIMNKFPELEKKIYILYPSSNAGSEEIEPLTLAAASPKTQKSVEVKVFSDKESKYLVKFIKKRSRVLMCIFTEKNENKKDLKITVYPTPQEYVLTDISKPIEVDPNVSIEKISIEES